MTNYEKIKSMSVEEMARFLNCPYDGYYIKDTHCSIMDNCEKCVINFLESEAEE